MFSPSTWFSAISSFALSASLLALAACGGGGDEATPFPFKSAYINSLGVDHSFRGLVEMNVPGTVGNTMLEFALPKVKTSTFETQTVFEHSRTYVFPGNAAISFPPVHLFFSSATYQIAGLTLGQRYCIPQRLLNLPESLLRGQTVEVADLNCFDDSSKTGESVKTKLRLVALSSSAVEVSFKLVVSSDSNDVYVEQFLLTSDGLLNLQAGAVSDGASTKKSFRVI